MGFLKSRSTLTEEAVAPPTPTEQVQTAAHRLEQAKRNRDVAIVEARRQRTPLREIAAAAGLSVPRIKQIKSAIDYNQEARPPVTETDVYLDGTTINRGDRILAIGEVAPFLQSWDSEKGCIDADPARKKGRRFDISHQVYDLETTDTWTLVYIENTKEIIAYGRTDTGETADMREGATTGPCLLLGHLPTWEVVEAAVDRPISNSVRYRPGGLAWVYGRIQATNRIIRAVVAPGGDLFNQPPTQVWEYLDQLPESEKP